MSAWNKPYFKIIILAAYMFLYLVKSSFISNSNNFLFSCVLNFLEKNEMFWTERKNERWELFWINS